jgi:hypothetical protein
MFAMKIFDQVKGLTFERHVFGEVNSIDALFLGQLSP